MATKLAPDAVVAFHAALRFHGTAHSATQVGTLNIHELVAEKLAALLAARRAGTCSTPRSSD